MDIELSKKFDFLFLPKRIKVLFGGRGGGKTVSVARSLLIQAATKKKRILCLRETMLSIDDSVHSALKTEVEKMRMGHLFSATNNRIDCYNGSFFKYAGLSRNIDAIKSKHDFDIAWVEEAETMSEKSLDVLLPTIRKAGSEIWLTFNPTDDFGAVYSRYVKPHLDQIREKGFYHDDRLHVVKVGLDDNPFAPSALVKDSAQMKQENLKKWLHIYGGECFSDYQDSIIQPEWIDAAIDAHIKLGFKPLGVKSMGFDPADTGPDAKALMLRHGSVITYGEQWVGGDLPEAIDRAFQTAYDLRSEHLVYDADGLGRGVKVGLERHTEGKNIVVTAYMGNDRVFNPLETYTEGKTNRDTFKNRRAQFYWYLKDRFEATYNALKKGIYTDPALLISLSSKIKGLDILKAELVSIRRAKKDTSFIQIESKKKMSKSPNMADALVMCFANPAPRGKSLTLNFDSEF